MKFSPRAISTNDARDTYSLDAQRAAILLKQEKFRREREQQEQTVPTSILANAFLELRSTIADTKQEVSEKDQQEVATLTELLQDHPNIRREFASLVRELMHAQKPNAEGKIHPVNTGDPEWIKRSQAWINALLEAVPNTNTEQQRAIRRSAETYFEIYSSLLYARTVERYIQRSMQDHGQALQDGRRFTGALQNIEKEVIDLFDLSPVEARHFVAMYAPTDRPMDTFMAKVAFLREVWEKNAKHIPRRAIVESSVIAVVTAIVDAAMPKRAEVVMSGDKFSLQAYIAYLICDVARDVLKASEHVASKKFDRHWQGAIDRRSIESNLFRRGEYSDEQNDRKRGRLVEGGQSAMRQLQHTIADSIGPTVVSLATTLAAMGRAHPLAALAGAGLLPVFGYAEHAQVQAKLDAERRRDDLRDALNEEVRTYPSPEEVRLSAEADSILRLYMGIEAKFNQPPSYTSAIKEDLGKKAFKYASQLVAGVATHLVQASGAVEGKALGEFTRHVKNLDDQVRALVRQTANGLDESARKIRGMERAFGPEEEYDIPHGPRERARVAASELPSYTITIHGLWYGVLEGVSQTIREGELVHIEGESGSGKSTFLKQIAGVLSPAYGEVRIGGLPHFMIRRYGKDSLYEIMAYAGQNPQINTDISVRDNLLSPTPSIAMRDEDIRSMLTSLGLEKYATHMDAPIGHPLSGGECVRFGIAKALVRRPKILLLDEPTGPLDQRTAREVWRLIDQVHASHPRMTMIVVTHDPIRLEESESAGRERIRVVHMDDMKARSQAPSRKNGRV